MASGKEKSIKDCLSPAKGDRQSLYFYLIFISKFNSRIINIRFTDVNVSGKIDIDSENRKGMLSWKAAHTVVKTVTMD